MVRLTSARDILTNKIRFLALKQGVAPFMDLLAMVRTSPSMTACVTGLSRFGIVLTPTEVIQLGSLSPTELHDTVAGYLTPFRLAPVRLAFRSLSEDGSPIPVITVRALFDPLRHLDVIAGRTRREDILEAALTCPPPGASPGDAADLNHMISAHMFEVVYSAVSAATPDDEAFLGVVTALWRLDPAATALAARATARGMETPNTLIAGRNTGTVVLVEDGAAILGATGDIRRGTVAGVVNPPPPKSFLVDAKHESLLLTTRSQPVRTAAGKVVGAVEGPSARGGPNVAAWSAAAAGIVYPTVEERPQPHLARVDHVRALIDAAHRGVPPPVPPPRVQDIAVDPNAQLKATVATAANFAYQSGGPRTAPSVSSSGTGTTTSAAARAGTSRHHRAGPSRMEVLDAAAGGDVSSAFAARRPDGPRIHVLGPAAYRPPPPATDAITSALFRAQRIPPPPSTAAAGGGVIPEDKRPRVPPRADAEMAIARLRRLLSQHGGDEPLRFIRVLISLVAENARRGEGATVEDLGAALRGAGLVFDDAEVDEIFRALDVRCHGRVRIEDLAAAFAATMTPVRRAVVWHAWQAVDRSQTGIVPASAAAALLDTSQHPAVLRGLVSEEDIREVWDRSFPEGGVSFPEFVVWHAGASTPEPSDAAFAHGVAAMWRHADTAVADCVAKGTILVGFGDGLPPRNFHPDLTASRSSFGGLESSLGATGSPSTYGLGTSLASSAAATHVAYGASPRTLYGTGVGLYGSPGGRDVRPIDVTRRGKVGASSRALPVVDAVMDPTHGTRLRGAAAQHSMYVELAASTAPFTGLKADASRLEPIELTLAQRAARLATGTATDAFSRVVHRLAEIAARTELSSAAAASSAAGIGISGPTSRDPASVPSGRLYDLMYGLWRRSVEFGLGAWHLPSDHLLSVIRNWVSPDELPFDDECALVAALCGAAVDPDSAVADALVLYYALEARATRPHRVAAATSAWRTHISMSMCAPASTIRNKYKIGLDHRLLIVHREALLKNFLDRFSASRYGNVPVPIELFLAHFWDTRAVHEQHHDLLAETLFTSREERI